MAQRSAVIPSLGWLILAIWPGSPSAGRANPYAFNRSMSPDFNCDLGEGEPPARTRALMRWITSANVACGGHAGDVRSMEVCVRLAKQFDVKLGAHPGPWSREDFGRSAAAVTPDELELLLIQQIGALERVAGAHGVKLHHIKLHGALYHASETNPALASRYIASVRRWWPRCVIYAQAGGRLAARANRVGLKVWQEAFVDRGYRDDSSLVRRGEAGAIITATAAITRRVGMLCAHGRVESISGRRLRVCADTICLHSDSPRSAALAEAVAMTLRAQKRNKAVRPNY